MRTARWMSDIPCEGFAADMECEVKPTMESNEVETKSSGNEDAIANDDSAVTKSGSDEDH